MSYVLDALKKADAERERGTVPGLHAHPISAPVREASGERSLPAWVWFLAGTASLLLLALLWLVLARDRAPPRPSLPTTAAQAAAVVQAPASHAAPAPRQEARPTDRPATATPRSEPEQPPSRSTAVVQAKSDTVERSAAPPAVPRRREPATAVSPPTAAAATQKPAVSAEERIFALKDLPEEVRRGLPPLNVGGSIYSDNPAGRFVIINGQVFHENDKLAPDLTLEQIRLKLAVLRYKDLRFRIMF